MPEEIGDTPGETPIPLRERSAPLRVMSFNVRLDNPESPAGHPDHWPDRAPLVTEFVREVRPHLLGTQEPFFHQLDALTAGLPGRRQVGYAREGGSRGEYNAVFYDPERLRLTGWDQLWLSDTPKVIGSTSWGNKIVRIVVRCDFVDRATDTAFTFFNTHFDHLSEQSRVNSARMLVDLVGSADGPVVITGDFNAVAGTAPAWQILTDAGLSDTWLAAGRHDKPGAATFHGYGLRDKPGSRIDWILTGGRVHARSADISRWNREGRYPSDHYPITADVVFD